LIAFLADYGAYLHRVRRASEPELRRRKQTRPNQIRWAVMEHLIEKWSVPDLTEAHRVELVDAC
jgi:hypothetical protein